MSNFISKRIEILIFQQVALIIILMMMDESYLNTKNMILFVEKEITPIFAKTHTPVEKNLFEKEKFRI